MFKEIGGSVQQLYQYDVFAVNTDKIAVKNGVKQPRGSRT